MILDLSTYQGLDLCFKALTLVGIGVAVRQLLISRRSHLFDVYREAMKLLDSDDVRSARNWVYDISPNLFDTEGWISLNAKPTEPKTSLPGLDLEARLRLYEEELERYNHKQMAERTARAFDRFGLLVREGRIPIDLVSHFYVTPILRCWYRLAPYIVRVRDKRQQKGHMWEFENLVFAVVKNRVKSGRGVWKNVVAHEGLEAYKATADAVPINLLREIQPPHFRDNDYDPPENLWHLSVGDQLRYILSRRQKA
jgi:hypothetical protein